MNTARLNRNIRRIHLWLGIGIGLQLGLWLISGLFMTVFPIDAVRGTHLQSEVSHPLSTITQELMTPGQLLVQEGQNETALTLTIIAGSPVYLLKIDEQTRAFDAVSGESREALSEKAALNIAATRFAGQGSVGSATFFADTAPREYGRSGPVWRVDFDRPDRASFYIDAVTGELKAVRTGLWRTFDFMWGLHIMDWSNRENFNSWWIRATATFSLFFFLSGFGLVVLRLGSMAVRRRRSKAEG